MTIDTCAEGHNQPGCFCVRRFYQSCLFLRALREMRTLKSQARPRARVELSLKQPTYADPSTTATQKQKMSTNNKTMQRVIKRVDAVVIGSGFAGLSAAYEAARLGTRVLLIDKMPTPGGNSVMNAGQIAAVGSPNQEEAGISDSVELMKQDMLNAGVSLNHPDLLEKMISQS